MYQYLEIRTFQDKQCVKRTDVTGWPERKVERFDNGINRNLNHDEYYTTVVESDEQLDEIE